MYMYMLGLNEIIPENLLSIFDETELEVSPYEPHPLPRPLFVHYYY